MRIFFSTSSLLRNYMDHRNFKIHAFPTNRGKGIEKTQDLFLEIMTYVDRTTYRFLIIKKMQIFAYSLKINGMVFFSITPFSS